VPSAVKKVHFFFVTADYKGFIDAHFGLLGTFLKKGRFLTKREQLKRMFPARHDDTQHKGPQITKSKKKECEVNVKMAKRNLAPSEAEKNVQSKKGGH
jgi:hypothetical protein